MVPLLWSALAGATELTTIEELDLERLLDLEYDVASRHDLPQREMPGAVTVLTRDDLEAAGARDLLDALLLLPGFAAGVDTWGTVGLGVRGNWSFEGKLWLRVDGVPMNELLYGTHPLGHRFPAWMIESIEVIRGPGSALYGGGAGLAVVDVTTVAHGDGAAQRGHLGLQLFDSGDVERMEAGAATRVPLGDDGRFAALVHAGDGARSDALYTDHAGTTIDLQQTQRLRPALGEVHVAKGGFDATLLAEAYRTTFQDGYDRITADRKEADFYSLGLVSHWAHRLGPSWTLTPRLLARRSVPWSHRSSPTGGPYFSQEWGDQVTAGVDADFAKGPVDVLLGAEGGVDQATVGADMEDWDFATGRRATYGRFALIQQLLWQGPVTLTVGNRLDHHSAYGWAWSPRVALTHATDRNHVKLLASRAFRSPSLEHLRTPVEPEYTHTLEAEAGVRPLPHTYLTAGAWHVRLIDPLLYFYENDVEGYRNEADTSGTEGVELEARWQARGASASVAWSTWRGLDAPPALLAVPGVDDALLGLPTHRAVARGAVPLVDAVQIGGVVTWQRGAWFRTADPAVAERLPDSLTFDAQVTLRDLLVDGSRLQLNAHDLLDAAPAYAQPYDGGHAPLPAPGRTVGLTVGIAR